MALRWVRPGWWLCCLTMVAALLLPACGGDSNSAEDSERQRAIDAAQAVYEQAAAGGMDFSDGPCIAEELEDVPGWSVDVAHDPRQEVDNQPENQCSFFRDGKTSHFVELDPEGVLIRAR